MGKARKHWKDCPAPGCRNSIPKANVFCFKHWFALPDTLRDPITAAMNRRDFLAKGKAVGEALMHFARQKEQDDPARRSVQRMLGERAEE